VVARYPLHGYGRRLRGDRLRGPGGRRRRGRPDWAPRRCVHRRQAVGSSLEPWRADRVPRRGPLLRQVPAVYAGSPSPTGGPDGLPRRRLPEGVRRALPLGKPAYGARSIAPLSRLMARDPGAELIHTTTNRPDVNILEVENLINALKAAGKDFKYRIYRTLPADTASTGSTPRWPRVAGGDLGLPGAATQARR